MDNDNITKVTVETIRPINVDTVHKICSGQVVLNLAVAVKELVENSLDAGATVIDVRFKQYGTNLIEVSDNGTGVNEDNFSGLTLKHHTSKLSDYSDLLGVSSFGFRGEALSSLCELADLTITTRHKSSQYAMKLEYDHKGHIKKKTPCSRQIGTTVSLSNLFYSLPVRQKEFHKNVKREFNKMTHLLYAYCLISTGVKITCTNQTSANTKTVVVATQGSMSYKDNIASVFGVKQLQSLLEVKPELTTNIKENIFKGLSQKVQGGQDNITVEDVDIDLSEDSNDADSQSQENATKSLRLQGQKNGLYPVEFTGYISSCAHSCGRSSADRQFYYVNSRPCEPTKVMKLVNEIYKQYNSNQYPFVFLNVNIEKKSVDINVSPDKRKIFLTKEKLLLDVLKNTLLKLYESIPRTLKVENNIFTNEMDLEVKPDVDQPRVFNSFLQQFGHRSSSDNSHIPSNEKTSNLELKRKSTTMLDFVSSKAKKSENYKGIDVVDDKSKIDSDPEIDSIKEQHILPDNNKNDNDEIKKDHKNFNQDFSGAISEKSYSNNESAKKKETDESLDYKDVMYLEYTDNLPNTQIRKVSEVTIVKSHKISCKTKPNRNDHMTLEPDKQANQPRVVTDKEDLGNHNRKKIQLKTSIEHVKALTEIYNKKIRNATPERVKFKSTINPVFNKKCEEELSKEISKDSFKKMEVVGQFNLGFIITKLDDDLFIIDQHATDEIYNFETLQKTTELTTQKLVIPQLLELSGVNEQILMDNLEVFKKNGFTFEVDAEALPNKRVKLLSLPMSKNWVFGKEDIEELLFMLRESPSQYCRPSRVRAMFASRACRKSVMIGTALGKADMKKLVDHMAEIDKPWNCPHGRPTIRHLVNLAMVHRRDCD